jgi:4-carboxymuconolactone decarboxylase
MSRLAKLAPDTLDDAQRQAYELIVASRTPNQMTAAQAEAYAEILGTKEQTFNLGGPFNAFLRCPDLATLVAKMGSFFRFGTSLPPRWVELAILTTARFWTAQYEWYAHARFASAAGVEDHIIDAIRGNQRPEFEDKDDEAVYEFCSQLHKSRQVTDQAYDAVTELLGERGVVELTGLIGFYTMISINLNTDQVSVPEGEELPPG